MTATADWVKIYTTSGEHLAAILQDMLEENEIPCTVLNKKDSAYGFGYIELYTLRENAVRARYLIEKSQA